MNALDLAEVEAAAVEARLELRSAESRAVEEKENLARILGLPASGWTLPETLPGLAAEEPALPALESSAVARNAGLIAAREEAEAGEKSHALSWLEALPSLKAGVSMERDDAGRSFVGPAVAAEVPLFDLGIPKRARTRAERDWGRQRLAAVEAELRPEIRRRYQSMITARRNYEETVRTLVPLREQATAEALKQYNFMLTGVYRLLTARREALSSHKMAVETLRDYWSERAELARMVGGPLPEPIAASPETPAELTPTEHLNHGAE
jgi:outer membrane protein TolC